MRCVRGAFFDLQMQYHQLHEQSQAQIARLSHLEAVAKLTHPALESSRIIGSLGLT